MTMKLVEMTMKLVEMSEAGQKKQLIRAKNKRSPV
jgi:hypothetical protein